ncbi:MAG: class I SAM-dependent methyltransferase [Flavobacteriales bacterium]|nr:class I SAM-dependent methyltransferase [Flavobacteriales bacterium]
MENNKYHIPPYSEEYADRYDGLWPENPDYEKETRFHIETINSLITPNGQWLDVGCGTGYFLSQFKGVKRAGIDISEPMLNKARTSNSDAMFFKTHDICESNVDWNDKWDLVTCTGQPWSYLNHIELIKQTVENLYTWTRKESGVCMLTPIDVLDMFNLKPEYWYSNSHFQKNVPTAINAIIWSLHEIDSGSKHDHLIYPNFDQWIRWFSLYFNTIEVTHWPIEGYNIPRRCIICRDKKEEPNTEEPSLIGI